MEDGLPGRAKGAANCGGGQEGEGRTLRIVP